MSAPGDKYSAARVPGREHIPLFPKGFIAVRIVQLVLCLLVLALSAYGIAGGYAANGIVFILAVVSCTPPIIPSPKPRYGVKRSVY